MDVKTLLIRVFQSLSFTPGVEAKQQERAMSFRVSMLNMYMKEFHNNDRRRE